MTEVLEFPRSRCLAGVAVRDVTPPVGIYHRAWGAAKHDRSTGVHRPLMATVLALAPRESVDPTADAMIFIGLDHCLLWAKEMDEQLQRVHERTGVDADRMIVYFSHTHAAGLMGYERSELPGGELIAPYLQALAERLSGAVSEALAAFRSVEIVYGRGACDLARNRDYFDARDQKFVCGFNPDKPADPTVVVGRVSDAETQQTMLTIVNYACHPTTLAWDNTLISPDYIGAMREVLEQAHGAPCLFIQGASGDVGPREGFVGDVEVADRNGRCLGYAALSALEDLPPVGMDFEYAGPVLSGATLGTWRYAPVDPQRAVAQAEWREAESDIELTIRPDLPRKEAVNKDREHWLAEEQRALAAGDEALAREARAQVERATRGLTRVEHLPAGDAYPFPLRLWRIGDAVWIALDGEHYNVLQTELRSRFPDAPLIIGTLANGSRAWYLPDEQSYGKGLYQEAVSVLARGSLERVIAALAKEIETLVDSKAK